MIHVSGQSRHFVEIAMSADEQVEVEGQLGEGAPGEGEGPLLGKALVEGSPLWRSS